jgi:hypothetical protein
MSMLEDNIPLHARKRSRFNGIFHQAFVRESAYFVEKLVGEIGDLGGLSSGEIGDLGGLSSKRGLHSG